MWAFVFVNPRRLYDRLLQPRVCLGFMAHTRTLRRGPRYPRSLSLEDGNPIRVWVVITAINNGRRWLYQTIEERLMEIVALLLFAAVFVCILSGYPVALVLAGIPLLFAFGGIVFGVLQPQDLGFLPNRVFSIMSAPVLVAVPLFIAMGVTLEKTNIAQSLLESFSQIVGKAKGGLGVGVVLIGALLAASTGIVGATVVTLALLALPMLLKQGYSKELASGTIAATGTLGQIIPPSIALVLIGDVLTNANQMAQDQFIGQMYKTVSVGELFAGSLIPGLILVVLYSCYVLLRSRTHVRPSSVIERPKRAEIVSLLRNFAPPVLLIVIVLGSILTGLATPTEAAGVGAVGALVLALAYRTLNWKVLNQIALSTLKTTSMVFLILIGASVFSLVFRLYGGDELVQEFFHHLPGGTTSALLIVMVAIFLLGFVLDFIEITYVVVPIIGPILISMGVDPVWLGVVIAVNLQTSFLTPPFGFALFYLRGVAPPEIQTFDTYKGVVPFICLQLLVLVLLFLVPALATWLPSQLL